MDPSLLVGEGLLDFERELVPGPQLYSLGVHLAVELMELSRSAFPKLPHKAFLQHSCHIVAPWLVTPRLQAVCGHGRETHCRERHRRDTHPPCRPPVRTPPPHLESIRRPWHSLERLLLAKFKLSLPFPLGRRSRPKRFLHRDGGEAELILATEVKLRAPGAEQGPGVCGCPCGKRRSRRGHQQIFPPPFHACFSDLHLSALLASSRPLSRLNPEQPCDTLAHQVDSLNQNSSLW
mmetsp:Transcript_14660/g.35592  ORF Transcript_14660/g.35592 Transcript_14660/m.35592 type:complete len:235 (-) Transcript_14660:26-730(-)